MKPVLKLRTFGSPEARFWLVLPVDAKELTAAEEVYTAVVANSTKLVYLLAAAVEDWNRDLSLWEAPPVFGKVPFSGGAEATRNALLPLLPEDKTLLLGGYSLAGLFALWAAYQTDRFAGAAAASPSVWFPGFTDYMRTHEIRCGSVYLSLGDREEKTRNPVMSTVGSSIRSTYETLKGRGTGCVLEWNPGNHFRDTAVRTAKAFAWLLNHADGIRDSRG